MTMRILVTDDAASMRQIIKGILAQLGYREVLEAADGNQALQLLRAEGADLLLLDWNMPRMTGIELVRAIRSDPQLKDLPIIMVTAEAEKQKVLEALKAGVNNFVVKPFTPETLKQKIAKVTGASGRS